MERKIQFMVEGKFREEQVLGLGRRACAEGNASFDVLPEKCALLVIDMQDEFVKLHWTPDWIPEATRQVPRITSADCPEMQQPELKVLRKNLAKVMTSDEIIKMLK